MKKLIVVTLMFVGLCSAKAQKVNWVSFEKAIELSNKNPKPILVDLYTDWCGWCKVMDKKTYSNKVIIDLINNNYYAVKLNGEAKEDIKFKGKTFKHISRGRSKYHELAVAILKGKMSYPSTAFFNSDQQLIQSIPGFMDKKKFEKIISFFGQKEFENTPWKDFEKKFKSKL